MTKIAAMPIYGKKRYKIIYFATKRPMTLKVGQQHRGLEYYQIYSNDNPRLTFTYFTERSNLTLYALYG